MCICSTMFRCNVHMISDVLTCCTLLDNVSRHRNIDALMINFIVTCYLMLSMCCQVFHDNVHMFYYGILYCTTLSCNVHMFSDVVICCHMSYHDVHVLQIVTKQSSHVVVWCNDMYMYRNMITHDVHMLSHVILRCTMLSRNVHMFSYVTM